MMVDLFDQIPYADAVFGKRFLMDAEHLKLIQVALRPGQAVPAHHTNGDVNILMLAGELSITLSGKDSTMRQRVCSSRWGMTSPCRSATNQKLTPPS